ncbi:AI-2E family transporter [Citricoccus sp. NPDC079358]|uniref:Putative PurR-regulated permease PerM n=1 Tax=Citricoccus muralis TaxID=169134 RepID=A0A3D9LBU4_9MICC|nr:AI-2E family transporter [Citricoccus muralis]REE03725.1 putative PurR-regulated permease PerM [Citricoccus muralis]
MSTQEQSAPRRPEGAGAGAGPWSDPMGRIGARAGQTLLIAAVAVGIIWVLLRVSVVVLAALVALILASAVAPLVRWLVGKGWSHLLATLTAFLGIVVVVGGVITGVVLAVINEWDSLVSSALQGWQALQDWVTSGPLPVDASVVDDAMQQVTDFVTSGNFASGLASSTLTGISAAGQFLTGLVLMIVVLFFLLKDGWKFTNFSLRWFQGGTRAKLAESIDRSSEVLGGYVRGTATVALVDAVLIGIALAILGVPLALPLAVIIFIGAFIPIVGATATGIMAALVALVTNGLTTALIVTAVVILVNQIEGNFLQPVVMGRTLSLHAMIVLLALTIGTLVGGIFGAILAVPYTAVAWTLIQVWSNRYQAGDDPVLGQDPLDAKDRADAKATTAQRLRYWRISRQRPSSQKLGAAQKVEPGSQDASGHSDASAPTDASGPDGSSDSSASKES